MKKLTVLLFAVVLGTSQLFASNNNPTANPEQKLRNKIAALLERPEISVANQDLQADIEFTLNTNGEIVVLTVNSEFDIVKSYVKSRLNYKKAVSETSNKSKVFRISLRIKKSENI
ncbi:hypothetical protein [Aquimarina sp. 2201CG5-10]|uniref:hypothetical protein n=1 Tax=Aquimarina callyspongiae TaxID=3098150 RepID=UPI002AB5689D|nr:hypothetical protein [Aquimarina sp. 2201CG5-10]MDY8134784.1 hypothetical protein [Aquimarina sp. 2201CG5-10]